MWIVVAYDIRENKTRFRVSSYLRCEGFYRLSRSVYAARGNYARGWRIAKKIKSLISEEDIVHIFFIQEQDYGKTIIISGASLSKYRESRGDVHTVFFG
ncbi:MAG: CRISPR-associated endonuclease Cas2 [Thermoprotei archaeon]|nr:MAG: CRISPR-associated endonuclease Cas2 [Thermoprotei archaeon]